MATILKITNGTTDIDFLGTPATYRVSDWTPAVAQQRRGELGGRGPYENVAETMVLSIKSSSPSAAQKLSVLNDLMDQAARWARGEPIGEVRLYYQSTGSGEAVYSTITGPVGDEPMVQLPSNFILSTQTTMIDGVVLRFRRMGLWLGSENTYDSGSASTMPVVKSVAVPDLNTIGYPVKLRLEGVGAWTSNLYKSFICLSAADTSDVSATRIKLLGAVVFAGGAYTSVNDSSNKPSNGSTILRYTPSTTDEVSSDNWSASTIDADVRRWGVFINYRNNHATTSFKVRALVYSAGVTGYTPYLTIPGGVSDPTYAFLGVASCGGPISGVQLMVTASAGAGSIDFDTVTLVAMDSPRTSHVVAVASTYKKSSLSGDDFIIDHRLLSDIQPAVYFDETVDRPVPYRGDAVIHLTGVYVYCICLVCGGAENPTHWRPSSGGTVFTNKWYFTTRTAYLIPE